MGEFYKIVFIGSGNVAYHFSLELYKKGHKIIQIFSHNEKTAKELALKVNSEYQTDINAINKNADIYIISIPDDKISEICLKLNLVDKLVLHTSGLKEMEILHNSSENIGIIYPLQTLTKNKPANLSKAPICIEANNEINLRKVKSLAESISSNVIEITSQQRKIIHLAAVFACNFTTRMYAIAYDLLKKENIDFKILIPLIEETAMNAQYGDPAILQTGPAKRNDINTIREHQLLLSDKPDYKNIYTFITENILKQNIH
ncbi:MAG: DUF2520 domain-containing protein [Bacteroidota bacterium]|nr:DUF2520 domain-containing protein [Bacteroidota bacterium]